MNVQDIREEHIRLLNSAANSTEAAEQLAENLYAVDLTVYSKSYCLKSAIYSAFSESRVDPKIVLHPVQQQIISCIEENPAVIISAPTSFGKTFCVFEYIAMHAPKTVVLVVPTLALVDEYMRKIVKRYRSSFAPYKVHNSIDPDGNYESYNYNLFVLTHDRIVQEDSFLALPFVDFLVIDEVYKLATDPNDDRVLVLNMAYYHLAKRSAKYVLLAPFLSGIKNLDELDKQPYFFKTSYSPVVNDVIPIEIVREQDRFPTCFRYMKMIPDDDKTLVYFPTVAQMYKFINEYVIDEPERLDLSRQCMDFIKWVKEEIHEDWCVIKAMERGYLVHNGQIPRGIRLFQLDQYERTDGFNRLLCTSTLLEGVNTHAKNILITKPARGTQIGDEPFSPFDFFNLVGRTGRLNQHLIGTAYYVRTTDSELYEKKDAVRTIAFEITDDSVDIDVQAGNIDGRPEVLAFLERYGISIEDYHDHIGGHFRFETVRKLFEQFDANKSELLGELNSLIEDERRGRYSLIEIMYRTFEPPDNLRKTKASLINKLTHKTRRKLKNVIDDYRTRSRSSLNLDTIIATAIKLKYSYIEHTFYHKAKLLLYYLSIHNASQEALDKLTDVIIAPIDILYFTTSKQRRMLFDLGICERDVDRIIRLVGDDFDNVAELVSRLRNKRSSIRGISFMSAYVIDNLI